MSFGWENAAALAFGAVLIYLGFCFGRAANSLDYDSFEYDRQAGDFYIVGMLCFTLGGILVVASPFLEAT